MEQDARGAQPQSSGDAQQGTQGDKLRDSMQHGNQGGMQQGGGGMQQGRPGNMQQGGMQQGNQGNMQQATQGNMGNTESSGRGQSDRQRSIETGRDTNAGSAGQQTGRQMTGGGGMGMTGGQSGTGMRRQGMSPSRSMSSDPFMAMQQMVEDMDRLFENFGFPRLGLGMSPMPTMTPSRNPMRSNMMDQQSMWTPQVEVFRRENDMIVRADLPGLKKDDIHLEVENGVLTLSGERHDERRESREGFYRSERQYGQFMRAIALPEGVDENACQATFNDGVLEVKIPMPQEQNKQARRVEIR